MKRLLFIWIGLAFAVSVMAQGPRSSTFGLDPSDSAAVAYMRHRMDSIRQHRPTVALVLSGGGAKGAATIGALKFLELYDIPIDLIAGTSIGGLVGGLYALGYDAQYLDSLVHNIDWNLTLSDKVDRSYVPYSRLRYKEKYLVSIPFYYRKDDYQNFISGEMPFASGRSRQLHLGASEEEETFGNVARNNLLGSLPSGFVYGQNVNQLLTSRTVGYSDSTDFFKLPIPFLCVATDVVTSRAKVWHSGSLNLALRSTMSIPGLFAPVRTQGMVLVDGGMRNNYPANLAKALGADIVIGIDLSTPSMDATHIQNLGDILVQGMDLFSNDAFDLNQSLVDLSIHPNLTGYNMLSFDKVSVDTMFVRGYRAAMAMEPQLDSLRERLGDDLFRLESRPATDLQRQPVVIEAIDIVGVPDKEADYIRSRMFVKPNSVVNRRVIENDIASIFAQGAYDYVNYELRGTEEPYRLRIICKRGPMHQLGLGFRIDSSDLVSILLNVGLNTHAMRGSALDITARVSANPYLDLHYTFNAPVFATLNVRNIIRYTDRSNFLSGTNQYNISFLAGTQELFFSNMHWRKMDMKLGLRNQFYKVNKVLAADVVGDYDYTYTLQDYPGVFIEGRLETMDQGYFPTKGFSGGIRADLMSRVFYPDAAPLFGIVEMDGMLPVSIGNFTLIPQGSLRFLFGDDIPLLYANVMGGDMRGRYAEQQIPFVGIDNAAFRRNFLIVGRMDARLRVGKNNYFSLMGNVSYDFVDFQSILGGEFVGGWGIGYGYNSIFGPLKVQLHWSTLTRKLGAYLSFGYNF